MSSSLPGRHSKSARRHIPKTGRKFTAAGAPPARGEICPESGQFSPGARAAIGANTTIKRGAVCKNIRLTSSEEEIEVRDGKGTFVLKTCFLRKG
jgi:hypothetical protein